MIVQMILTTLAWSVPFIILSDEAPNWLKVLA